MSASIPATVRALGAVLVGEQPIDAMGAEGTSGANTWPVATGEMSAARLTEPDNGSDTGSMTSVAERIGGGYRLTAPMTWISNASYRPDISHDLGPARRRDARRHCRARRQGILH